jgi:hypothetical protein
MSDTGGRFSGEISLGAIVQALTVMGSIAGAMFYAGQWFADLRADLREETIRRENAVAMTGSEVRQLSELVRQRDMQIIGMGEDHQQIIAATTQIERSFQHFFAAAQPQRK